MNEISDIRTVAHFFYIFLRHVAICSLPAILMHSPYRIPMHSSADSPPPPSGEYLPHDLHCSSKAKSNRESRDDGRMSHVGVETRGYHHTNQTSCDLLDSLPEGYNNHDPTRTHSYELYVTQPLEAVATPDQASVGT